MAGIHLTAMGFKTLACAIILSMTMASCAGEAGPETTEPGQEPSEVLIRIESTGGFVPLDWLIGRGPTFTLTTDGKLIFEGPVLAIFPGPLMPGYQVVQVTEGEIRQIRMMIDRMGLPDMVDEVDDSNASHVADATTEVITFWDSKGAHRYSVYALGLGMGTVPPPSKVFEELRTVLDTLAYGRDAHPYQAERVRVIAGEGAVDPDFADLRDWPLDDTDPSQGVDLGNGWKCRAFAADVIDNFGDATQVTVWRNPNPNEGPAEIRLLVRPLHPGEEDCPSLP